ncbi:hypothetical protein EBESD8_7980 [Rhodococcus aetherivorans]|nr:hypothetical protein EBESD8_7980 [Rhodococcus aetherivorans]
MVEGETVGARQLAGATHKTLHQARSVLIFAASDVLSHQFARTARIAVGDRFRDLAVSR